MEKIKKFFSLPKVKYILYFVIIITFIFLSTIIALKHEYWPDEANAWLIANDSSILQLFTKYLHSDGHPALFHLIIKAFSLFGLTYKDFHIISILFSTLGVTCFVFKSNYKWYLKLLLPFTFFIFYQYTVITRGYCLVLLLLSLIANIWNKKKEKCITFSILLLLLLSLESYTFFFAGSIYLLYILDYIKGFKESRKHNMKMLICLIGLFIAFLLTTIYVMPRSTNTFNTPVTSYYLSDSFITPFNMSYKLKIVFTFIVTFIFCYFLIKSKKRMLEIVILLLPLLGFMIFKYCNLWHTGMLFLAVLFIGWIYQFHKIKLFNIFMLLTCIVQIYWSFNSSVYDYKESYSPAKEVADFIKTYDYKNMKICGLEFYSCATNAYFDENIFYNWNKDIRFFYWDKSSRFYDYTYDVDSIVKENVEMLVVTPTYQKLDRKNLKKYYDEYSFDGATYFQVDEYESMKTYVYIRKDNQVD